MAKDTSNHGAKFPSRALKAPLIGALLLALLSGILVRSRSLAFVDALYSLKQVMEESKCIVEGEIEAVDQSGRTATAKVKATIKGKCPFKHIKMSMGVGQSWFPEVIMKRLKVGAPVLYFWDDGLRCLAYTNGFFFQLYGQPNADPEAVWWNLTHIEIKMNRTFRRTTEELTALVRDVVAGKRAPPAPDPSFQPLTRDELEGASERPEAIPFGQTDEPDGLEACPQWKTEPWSRPVKPSIIFAPPPGAAASELSPGLMGEYYGFTKALAEFPDVADCSPVLRRADKQVNFGGAPFPGTNLVENFCVRWTGFIRVAKDGKYKITADADDAAYTTIDGKLATGIGGEHGSKERGGEVELAAGDHAVKVDYFKASGPAFCKLLWEGPGVPKAVIPEKALFHRSIGLRGEVLRVEFAYGNQERSAVSRKMDEDWTQATRLLYEALNQGNRAVRISWGFTTMPGEQYFESASVELPPGQWVHDLQVDLTAQTFKCAYTNWLCRSPLQNRGKIVKLTLDVYDAPATGAILVDRVRPDGGSLFIRSIPLAPPAGKTGTASWVDCDNFGKLDVFLCNEGGLRVFRNTAGEFADVTSTLFPPELINRQGGGSLTGSWVDCESSARPALLLSTGGLLRRVMVKYALVDMGIKLPGGVPAQEAVWLDANGDGRPDVLLTSKQGGTLLLNTGQGQERFKDAGAAWGLAVLTGPLGLSVADVDGDGLTDVLCHQGTGLLLHNEEGKAFRSLASTHLDYSTAQPLGAAWGDFDNDGNLDLFVPQNGKCQLYRNNGDLTFTDVIAQAGGLAKLTGSVRTAVWGDVNLDGNLDLIVGFAEGPARIYLGDGKGKFNPGQSLSAFECTRGASGMALGDWDGDGDLDLLVLGEKCAGILINQCPRPPGMSVLRVRLPANRSLGALVRLYDKADKPMGVRQVGLAGCFSSQEPSEAFFAVKPGNYKVAVMSTNGTTKQSAVTVTDKGYLLKITQP